MYLKIQGRQETSPGPHYFLVCVQGAGYKQKMQKLSEIIPGTNKSVKKCPEHEAWSVEFLRKYPNVFSVVEISPQPWASVHLPHREESLASILKANTWQAPPG